MARKKKNDPIFRIGAAVHRIIDHDGAVYTAEQAANSLVGTISRTTPKYVYLDLVDNPNFYTPHVVHKANFRIPGVTAFDKYGYWKQYRLEAKKKPVLILAD